MDLPPPTPNDAATAAPARPRYRRRRQSAWQRVPIAVKVGLPMVAVAVGWFAWSQWQRSHAVLRFAGPDGAVPPLQLTVYPERLAFNAPSPPPPLGQLRVEGDEVVLPRELVPDSALVRYEGEGIGTGFAYVTVGRQGRTVQLGPPASLPGTVAVAHGALLFGLRGTGLQPVAGARVYGLGGGEHGVVLCEALTDAEGRFRLDGFDGGLPSLGVRVLAAGYAVAGATWYPGQDGPLVVPLVATEPIRGRAALPETFPAAAVASLQVLAKGLPGVSAALSSDGSFRLDHVPPNFEPRLLLYGLPAGYTHRQTHGAPGDEDVEIDVVPAAVIRGWVFDRATQLPMGGAAVWHDHGPAGHTIVQAAADGSFVLERVPPGEIRLHAQHNGTDASGDKLVRTGQRWLEVEAGVDQQNIIIRVD